MSQNSALARARELIGKGRLGEAVALLEGHRLQPECAVALREIYLGDHDNARALPLAKILAVGEGGEAHVSRSVIALVNGDLDGAVNECQLALAVEPGLPTAHNHLGRALQNAGHTLQAISSLRKAVELRENYPEAWYNLALVLRASGAMDEALNAYRRALDFSPGYRAADLNLGISLLLLDRVDEALFCFEAVLEQHPDDVESLVNAGLALQIQGEFMAARQHLEHAVELAPDYPLAHAYLGVLLHEINEPEAALESLQAALRLDPMDVEAWVEVASIHEQANRLDEARAAIEQAMRADAHHPALHIERARLLRREGDFESAGRALQGLASAQLPPRLGQQYWFELGLTLDRLGHYDQALEAFAAGNQVLAASIRRRDIDPQGFERRCRALEDWLQRGTPGAEGDAVDGQDDQDLGADLCFLVGFPRSGTTLLDTMLDAHPDVASIEELPTLEAVLDELRSLPGGYPAAMEKLDGQQLAQLRSMYREQCRRYLDGQQPVLVVDKLPMRFLNAGLIHRLFPEARILFALRHPCDVVLSNFMQAYAANEAFIHFDTLADSARMYDRAMGLWHRIAEQLPLRVHYTRYEDMVEDDRAEMGRVCEFLGLEPVEAMFDAAARMAARPPVRTTSYQQVVEPVYGRAAGRWVRYRRHLEPFLAQLQPHLEQLAYTAE